MSNRSLLRHLFLAGFAAATVLLTGCANVQYGPPVPSQDNIEKARALGKPVAVGEFALAAGKPKSMDEGISVRGSNSAHSPYNNSFALYLKETLATELKSAGMLDPKSNVVIKGWLTDSQLDAGMSDGSGALAARFVVERDGKAVFDKELKAESKWPSSFVAATAVPAALNGYNGLFRQLVGQLLADGDFKAALK